jgi:hypothetical protein
MKNDIKDMAEAYTQASVTPAAERLRKLEERDRQRELAAHDSNNVVNRYFNKKPVQLVAEQNNEEFKEKLKELQDIAYELFEIGSRIKYKQVRAEDADFLHNASRKMQKILL